MKRPFRVLILACAALAASGLSFAEEPPKAETKNVKYRAGKDVNFEELLIQGQLKRPEITVVTGDAAQGTDGLLRLRTHFLDRMASDIGEVAAP